MASVPPSIEPPGAAGGDDEQDPAFGPPPEVAGRDAIKARAFERLFGGEGVAASPSSGTSVTLGRDPLAGDDGAAPDPQQIGRFKILERLGRGGMGVVWSAWDPELERRVAIKVLRPDLHGAAGTLGHARLLREAQAMARINHPHVIAVHEVGSLGEQVFVAMELVIGTTLTAWLAKDPHRWRETLARFLAAGDGIAAAHAAGVVHRDFKPDNVLVGDDGRVRVVDFGLARSATELATEATAEPTPPVADADAMATPLTRTGAIMGTPAYMSPEQWLGRPADERSDQFSFCVALYEALHGQRPFKATTVPELAGAVTSGRLDVAAGDGGIPRFVDQALLRGLAREPDARHPSMGELLAALRRDPARVWRRATAVAGVALAASGMTLWLATDRAASRCDGVADRLVGVWDDDVRARVQAALVGTGAPFAERTWESTVRLVDGYAATWIAAAGEACASASVAAADQDDARRERCLDTRVAELHALAELLESADIGVAMQAVDAAARLPDPRICFDARRLVAYRDIADAQARDRAANARATLGRASAAGAVGRYADAIAQADEVGGIAHDLDDPALEAAALLVRGQNEAAAGDNAKGEQSLRRAVSRAELADDHATRAQALTHLVYLVGQDSARFAEARALGADAGAVLRVIGADPLLRAQLDGALGVAAKRGGDLDLALEHHRAALDATRELYGDDHPATLRALANLAIALRTMNRDDEAEPMLAAATAGLERVLGENHPAVATSLSNLAIAVAQRGRPDEAVALLRRSLAIRERNDPGHPSIATGHFNLARALYDTRSYAEAREQYEAGLALRRKAAPTDPMIASYWAGIGRCALRLGDIADARAAFEQQLALDEKSDMRGEADAARVDLARTLVGSDPQRAKALVERARRGIDDRGNRAGDRALAADLAIIEMLIESVLLARQHGGDPQSEGPTASPIEGAPRTLPP